jgi:hypothetical protein
MIEEKNGNKKPQTSLPIMKRFLLLNTCMLAVPIHYKKQLFGRERRLF